MRTGTKEGTHMVRSRGEGWGGGGGEQGWVPRLSMAVRVTSARSLGTKDLWFYPLRAALTESNSPESMDRQVLLIPARNSLPSISVPTGD